MITTSEDNSEASSIGININSVVSFAIDEKAGQVVTTSSNGFTKRTEIADWANGKLPEKIEETASNSAIEHRVTEIKLKNEFIRFLVDIGMKVVDDEDSGKSKSITLLHDGTGVLYLLQIDIASENLFSVHFKLWIQI